MAGDRIDKLYNALKADGTSVPSRDIFRRNMLAPGKTGYNNRLQFFKAMKADGADVGNTYEDFAKSLGLHAVGTPTVNKYRQQMFNSVDPTKNKASELTRKAVKTAHKAMDNVRKPVRGAVVNKQGKKVGEFDITPAKTLDDLNREYAQEVVSDWEKEQQRQSLYNTTRSLDEVQRKIAERDAQLDEADNGFWTGIRHAAQGMNVTGGMFQQYDDDMRKELIDPKYKQYLVEANYLTQMKKQLIQEKEDAAAPNATKRDRFKHASSSFTSGMVDEAFGSDAFDFGGYNKMRESDVLLRINDRINRGVATDDDRRLLQILKDKEEVESRLGNDAYSFGRGASQSAGFVTDFLITGGGDFGGLGRLGGKMALGLARKTFAKTMTKDLGKRFAAWSLKNLGKTLGEATGAAMTATSVQIGKTAGNATQRYLGLDSDDGGLEYDKDGNLKFKGGTDVGTAIAKAIASGTIENYTELLGPHITSMGKRLFGWGGVGLEKITPDALSKFFDKVGSSELFKRIGTFTDEIANSKVLNAGKKALSNVGVNDMPEEGLEEEAGIILNSLITGDNKFSDLWDKETQYKTWGGVMSMMGAMRAIPIAKAAVEGTYSATKNKVEYFKCKHDLTKAETLARQSLGDKWTPIKELIDNADNKHIIEVGVNIIRQSDKYSQEQAKAAQNYIGQLLKMRGFNNATMASIRDKNTKGEGQTDADKKDIEVSNAYAEGHEAEGELRHQIQLEYEKRKANLAKRIGLTPEKIEAMNDASFSSYSGLYSDADFDIFQYKKAKAAYDGVMDNAQNLVDIAGEVAAQRVDNMTNVHDGTIRKAFKKCTEMNPDSPVYIISGNIELNDDGSINYTNSDKMIVIYDEETGQREAIGNFMLASVDPNMQNAEEVKAQAIIEAKQKIITEQSNVIDGILVEGSEFSMEGADGITHNYNIVQVDEQGNCIVSVDGTVLPEPLSLEAIQQQYDQSNVARSVKNDQTAQEPEQTTQDPEQTQQESQPIEDKFDYSKIANQNDGKVKSVVVTDEEGNKRFPNAKAVFLIQDKGAMPKYVVMDEEGNLTSYAGKRGDKIHLSGEMTVDEYKKQRQEELQRIAAENASSSMIEGNSGENRGEIEAETPAIEEADNSSNGNENNESLTFEDGTPIPVDENGETDLSQTDATHAAEWYDNNLGEDADGWLDGEIKKAKKVLEQAKNRKLTGTKPSELVASKKEKEAAIADAQARYDSVISIRDLLKERRIAKEENTPEGRKNLIDKARRKFARLKSTANNDAEAVLQLYRDTVGSLLHRLYDGTGIDVTDTVPLTAEEYVASNLSAHTLNYEGTETSKGVKQETGLSREDFAKTQLLAADGKGTTIDNLVHSLWENRPSNLDSLNTQDIRNALIGVLTSGFKASEARSYVENIRIAQAEKLIEEERTAAENAAYYEQQKAKEEEEKKKAELEKKAEEEKKKAEENIDLPAIDKQGEPINNNIIELAKWAKKQGLEIDPTSKLNSYADLFLMCKDGFGVSTLVPDEGKNINQVIYFPDNAEVVEQLGKLQEEFNAGRDLNHSSNIDSEITEGATFYDAATAKEFRDFANEQTKFPDTLREGSNAIEAPEDATDEKPLGEQRTDSPFSARKNGKQQTEAERAADVEKNKVDDIGLVDAVVGEKIRKAFERIAKMMGAEIQYQRTDKMGNGWIEETKDADGNVHRTIFITLDSSITEGAQFIFGHEMTHQIKNLNPSAYNELTQLVLDTYGSDAFDKAVDKTMKRYSDAGFSGRARDYYAEEVVADSVGEMIRDLNLTHTLAMKMSHPLLAAIHEILQKIKLAFFGTEYSDVTKNIIRSIEQAYVKTANGEVTNSETGEDVSFSLRQKPEPKKKGIGYKVFVLKDGKLYPPMVANPDGAATPVGVWLDADAAPIAGESKTGRPQVKQGGKGTQGGSGKLAYRPGWHLGVVPYAIQFNRNDAEGNKTLFPKNFVFAEVEYAADVDYQEEARQEGINPSGKYQHSLAGLKHLPTDGYYMYRTNPNPETDPWVITGAMKVNRILTRAEQADLVSKAGREPQQIQEGDIVTDDVVNSINQEIANAPKFSLKVYHGSGADFTEFDFDHMGEGAGSQVFGWGGYVTSSKEIGKSYVELTRKKPTYVYNGKEMSEDYLRSVLLDKVGIDNVPILDDFLYYLEKYGVSEAKSILRKGDYAYFKNLLKGTLGSVRSAYQNKVDAAELLLAPRNIRVKKYKGNLYEVDIPDDNGSNYLDWDAPITDELIDKVAKALPSLRSFDIKDLKKDRTFENLYKTISMRSVKDDATFNDDKAASKLLASLGYTGIKYKAGRNFGGAEEGDTNYVIFKPEDMKITEHTKFSLKSKPVRFEAGKKLSDEEKKEVLSTLKDAYKVNGVPYHIEETAGGKEKRVYEPTADSYVVSDITNRPLRYYITLPDGRVAHPTEVYPNISDNEVKSSANKQGLLDDEVDQIVGAAIGKMKDIADKAKAVEILNELQNLPHETHDVGYGLNHARSYNYKTGIFTSDAAQAIDYVVRRMRRKEDVPAEIPAALKKAVADSYGMVDNLIDGMSNTKVGADEIKPVSVGVFGNVYNQFRGKAKAAIEFLKKLGSGEATAALHHHTIGDISLVWGDKKTGLDKILRKHPEVVDNLQSIIDSMEVVQESDNRIKLESPTHFAVVSKEYKGEPREQWLLTAYEKRESLENGKSMDTATSSLGGDTALSQSKESAAKIDNSSETSKENGEKFSLKDEKIKSVAEKFGVNEDDVAMYANAVEKGSTAEAARARANINRYLLQANEDKISSLKDIIKYTKPINEALKENFGDLDAMIEERRKQVEAQRNAMEAARKRAQEEEEKRQKHLDELSLIPTDELDKRYMDAIANNDESTAREMLDESARRNGYGDVDSDYQGQGAWAAPSNPQYESDEARRADIENSPDVNLEDIALGYNLQPDDYFDNPRAYMNNTAYGLESAHVIKNALDSIKNGEKDVKVKVYRAVPTSVKEGKLRNGDWVTPSKKYAEMHGDNRLDGKYRIIEDEVSANQLWWDGNDVNEFGFDDGKEYRYKNAKNNRKLNDLITYDNKGNVIPPSKRFNSRKSDIRFSLKSMMEKPEGWKQANKKTIHIAEAIERDPKFSLKNLDGTLIKAGTYFSGGGLVEEGLKGIIDPVVAVEYDEKISGVYRNNFGQHIVTADVRDVDPKELVKQIDGEVEYFHASPVCKNYSQAKSNHAEVELDKETAASTADFINAVKPKVVTIENVKGYKDSEAMKIITDALDANGYTWDADVYNAADYGGYTNRERLIVRAVRDGKLPAKPKKMAHKSGWYEAVADIIPTLTEKKNGVAPWMDIRLKADGIDWRNIDKPLYVMGSAYADGKVPHAFADELLPTLRTKSGDVIVMPDGKVYRALGRVLARVSGVSDDYKMPFSESLSHTIIGNGIPTQLTEHVIAPLLQNTLRPTTPEEGNTRFSLRGSTPYDKQMEEWMEKNHLEKGAVPMEKPIMGEGENIFDYANRMVEWTRNQNLWKTAPKQTGFQDALEKWKADNSLSPDAYPPVRPHRENYSSESDYAEDLEEYNKKKELWKSAPKPKDFDLSVDLEDMNKQLRNIRRAVLNQKNYDQRTVKAVSDLVRKMLNIGWGDGLSRGKVANLLSAAKNATGANDVKKYLDKAMGILAENYLNRLSTAYDNLINTKGARADQSGVIKMGSLDAKGQAFMSEYKKAINMDDSSLNTYIANIEEDSAKNEDNVEMNDYRLAGIQAAIMYKQQIGGNDADIAELKRQIGELKNKKDATKEDKDLLKSLEKKLFENKFDRITMYENLLNNIQRMVKESKGRAKEFREELAEHKNEILHRANLDLEGVDSAYYDTTTAKKKFVNNPILRFVMSSTYTFEQFLKFFGRHHANGEGYLYNYFMSEWQDAADEQQLYNEMNRNALDEKTKELFGKKNFTKLVGIDGKGMKEMDVEVTDYSNKETGKRTIHLKQGQMLYIYLVNKETDGEMKLRAMGITEEKVAEIEENLDPRVKAMGEWLQDEYLPECQRRYQATHTKYFGAPMKEVENYFPLAINNRARNIREDLNQDTDAISRLAGTSTGAIITRRVNVIPLDIENADAFAVAFNHLDEMEEWSAYLPFIQDVNTLLSSTHFRNQVMNMSSAAYGSGKTLWEEFKKVAQIAAGTYKPKVDNGMMDSKIAAVAGGIATAKISGRLWTAFKQTQSATTFLTECDPARFLWYGVNPYGSWHWAYDNLPLFRKRVEQLTAGDVKVRQFLDELEKYHDWTKTIAKVGMSPNILVDSVTCAVGARSVYETELNKLTKLGYSKDKAEEKAIQKASLSYNKTQQSSEGAFLSPMQVDRTYVSAALSLYKNANYAYGRKKIEAIRGIAKTYRFWGEHKNAMIGSMTRQIMDEDGLDENVANAIAKRAYTRTFWYNIGTLLNYMTIVPISWAAYKVLLYLLNGDDDDKKKKMIEEACLKGFATTTFDDYVIPFASNVLNAGLNIEDGKIGFDTDVFKYQNLYINPATSDLSNIYSMIGNQKWWSAGNKFGMLGIQMLVGFNPETIGALYQAYDEFDKDSGNMPLEIKLAVLKSISAPEESIRGLYMDELGLDNEDRTKVPLSVLEQRYAERQINRDNLLSQIAMPKETFDGYVEKYKKSFEKKIQDKMDKMDAYEQRKFDAIFDTTTDPALKGMMEKKRTKDANAAADEQIAKEGLNQEKKGKEPSEEAYDAVKMSIDVAEDNAISTYNKVLNKRYAALNDEYNNQTDAMKYIFMSKHPNFKAYKDLESEYTTYGKKMKELKEKLVSAEGYDAKQTILKQIRSEREKFSELQSKVR